MSESRFAVECRSEVTGNRLVGHAAVFGQYAELPGHLETLHRSAFDKVLRDESTDVVALFNHDQAKLLGRQSSGTLRLGVDSTGLAFELDLPDTTDGRDVKELASRGDLTGASFGFIPGEDEWSSKDGRQLRTHVSVAHLRDVSPVSIPAYKGASVMLRSLTLVAETGRGQLVRARARLIRLGG
jgi:HK97 family phage prohead protease